MSQSNGHANLVDLSHENRLQRVEEGFHELNASVAEQTATLKSVAERIESSENVILQKMDWLAEKMDLKISHISKETDLNRQLSQGSADKIKTLEAYVSNKNKWSGMWRKVLGGVLLTAGTTGIAVLVKLLIGE